MLKLKLPQELSRVHNAFHVSNLKKCCSEDPLVVPLEGLHVDDKLHFVEEPVEIMNREAGAAMPEQYKPLTVLHPVSFNASTDPCSTTFSPRPTHATLPSHFPKTPSKSTSPQI
ncbi:hypothetical protein Tco_1538368 [Tanacetum coccineum]